MLILENHIGKIIISERYLADLIEYTVTNCFGVAGMDTSSPIETVLEIFKHKKKNKGVTIYTKDNKLVVDLHISVAFGVNISVITDSIRSKIEYAINEATGFEVEKVNVFIDNMNS